MRRQQRPHARSVDFECTVLAHVQVQTKASMRQLDCLDPVTGQLKSIARMSHFLFSQPMLVDMQVLKWWLRGCTRCPRSIILFASALQQTHKLGVHVPCSVWQCPLVKQPIEARHESTQMQKLFSIGLDGRNQGPCIKVAS